MQTHVTGAYEHKGRNAALIKGSGRSGIIYDMGRGNLLHVYLLRELIQELQDEFRVLEFLGVAAITVEH